MKKKIKIVGAIHNLPPIHLSLEFLRRHGITNFLATPFRKEFCKFMNNPRVRSLGSIRLEIRIAAAATAAVQ